MTGEFVTCVVPVRDGEAFLAETIESVLGQTYTERELIRWLGRGGGGL